MAMMRANQPETASFHLYAIPIYRRIAKQQKSPYIFNYIIAMNLQRIDIFGVVFSMFSTKLYKDEEANLFVV